jgi:hypothetical protein
MHIEDELSPAQQRIVEQQLARMRAGLSRLKPDMLQDPYVFTLTTRKVEK